MQNYSREELEHLLGAVGLNVAIHRSVAFFNPKQIFLGSNVRIDCFCLLSAGSEGIYVDDYSHLGAASHLFGSGGRIHIQACVGISSRVSIFTSSDDYTEGYLATPMVPLECRKVQNGPVTVSKGSVIGCGSIVMPCVTLHESAAVGAMSFVRDDVEAATLVAGIPAKKLKKREGSDFQIDHFLAHSMTR
jgi:carbonic anhydrase/acetyltransferase-like protein (isoleucine patch superfamily)